MELPNQWLWDIIDEFIYQVCVGGVGVGGGGGGGSGTPSMDSVFCEWTGVSECAKLVTLVCNK